MSRFVNGLPVRLDATLLWPLAVAGSIGYVLLAFHLQPLHYFLLMNVCIVFSLIAGKRLRNGNLKSFLKRSFLVVACLILLGLMIVPTRAALITEYSMNADPRPHGITVDPGGTVWFTEELGNRIGKLGGSQVTEYNIPTLGSAPWGIVYDPNPNGDDPNADSIWFTESGQGKIGRFRGNVFSEFKLGNPADGAGGGSPRGITFDYNVSSNIKYKNIWFVEFTGQAIGKIYYNATKLLANRWVMTEYAVPTDMHEPIDLARNPVNGLMFFCSYTNSKIASFDPWTYQFKVYDVASAIGDLSPSTGNLQAIAIGSDGIVWAALDYVDSTKYDKIVRLDPWSGQVVAYEIPTQGSGPRGLAMDQDNNVWFTEYDQDKIGRLNPIDGYITEFNLPNSGSHALALAISSATGRDVWFTEYSNNKIGKLDPTSVISQTTVNTITSATSSTANTIAVTTTAQAAATTQSVMWSTNTIVSTNLLTTTITTPNVVSFTTAGNTLTTMGTAFSTMSTFVRFATSSQTTNVETVFVLPTSTTASTTLTFVSTTTTTTTVSPTLTSAVSTQSFSTTTTTSATFSTPVETASTFETIQQVFTQIVATTTETNFAATSFRFSTVTAPFLTQYSTSTIRATTTTTLSTVTTTSTVYSTSTLFTTAGFVTPALFLLAFLLIPSMLRRRRLPRRAGENK
jgi:virginiamycin B lyase